MPDSGPMPRTDGYRGVRVIDGQSGRTRWIPAAAPENQGQDGLLQILDAPDLDHDGVRDLVTSSFFLGRYLTTNHNGTPPVPERVYVDALSGKDGRPLWWWNRDNATDRSVQVGRLQWWGRGPDGWPLLAVPIGQTGGDVPPIVESLEASTGRVVSSAVGLSKPGVADLDGDGLGDLWGEADGQLRAFRGETPELWRRWDRLPRHVNFRGAANVIQPAADLDGDGIADTLIAGLRAPFRTSLDSIAAHAMGPSLDQGFRQLDESASAAPGSRTAIARSGRDGRVIWKTELDPRRISFERDRGETYGLTSLSLPAGDFDGDGKADVLVQKYVQQPGAMEIKQVATLPLQVLSGRTGERLWAAGPLPLGFEAYGYSSIQWAIARVVEPHGAPDVFVRHISPFVPGRPGVANAGGAGKPRLARISGRNGTILWDIPLSENQESNNFGGQAIPGFDDLDGDGALELVTLIQGLSGTGTPDCELRAISLKGGKPLWSIPLVLANAMISPQVTIGDLDGDRRPEVVFTEHPGVNNKTAFVLKVIDGKDGAIRWSWKSGEPEIPNYQVWGWPALANFSDDGRRTLCLNLIDPKGRHRILVFDEKGRECAHHEFSQGVQVRLNVADVDGDGRDELLVRTGEDLRVWTPNLEDRWSYASPGRNNILEQVLPAPPGRPATVIVPNSMGLDGSNGHPQWSGQSPYAGPWGVFATNVLDRGDASRPPSYLAAGIAATVCRSVLPTTPTGGAPPAQGALVPPNLARDDPRCDAPAALDDRTRALCRWLARGCRGRSGPFQHILTASDPSPDRIPAPLDDAALDDAAGRRRGPTDGVQCRRTVNSHAPRAVRVQFENHFLRGQRGRCADRVLRRRSRLGPHPGTLAAVDAAGRRHPTGLSGDWSCLALDRHPDDALDRTLLSVGLVPGAHCGCVLCRGLSAGRTLDSAHDFRPAEPRNCDTPPRRRHRDELSSRCKPRVTFAAISAQVSWGTPDLPRN